jgi:O-Antigen ligase
VLCRLLCALLFVAWTAESQREKVLYYGYWRSPFQIFGWLFESLPIINLVSWQVLLLALVPLCLLRPGAFRRRAWPMDAAILTSFVSVMITFVWGWIRGGSPYNAYYQLWRFLVGLLVSLLLVSVIRSSRDLKALGFTILLAALVRGTLAMYFYWAVVRGNIEPPPPYMTTHDDSLLFVAGVLISLSWALARSSLASWLIAALVSAHLLYAITLNNRRLAWIELALVLALAYWVLPRGRVLRRVNVFLLVTGPVLLAYVVGGWGREGAFFAPLRAFSTAGSYQDNSSLGREEETRNLLYTLSTGGNPLLGTGWGIPYAKVTSVYSNFEEWWQYRYLPHNSLLGVAVFGGVVGIFGIWLVVPVAAFLAMRGYRASTNAVDRAAAMAALCILAAYGAQCYGDIGFQALTCNLILGVALAVGAKVAAWSGASPEVGQRGGRRGTEMMSAAPVPAEDRAPTTPGRQWAVASGESD